MNNLKSNYKKHTSDVYDCETAMPTIDQSGLSELTTLVREQAQPLLWYDTWKQRLDEYQEAGDQEPKIVDRCGHIVNLEPQVVGVGRQIQSTNLDNLVLSNAERLVKALGLDEVVELKENGTLSLESLRKVLKTAHWLNRNLRKYN